MKILALGFAALSILGSSAFAGGHIRMTSPDYSVIDDLYEAQYEAQIQNQLDEINWKLNAIEIQNRLNDINDQ